MQITVTSVELLKMSAGNSAHDAQVFELQGPPRAYFEVPLDWFATAEGELTPAQIPGAVRLIQRVHYVSFLMLGDDAADVQGRALKVLESVRAELKRVTEQGYIWWRLFPKYEVEDVATTSKPARHRVRMRLGTLPTLTTRFWLDLSKAVGNASSEPLVPRA